MTGGPAQPTALTIRCRLPQLQGKMCSWVGFIGLQHASGSVFHPLHPSWKALHTDQAFLTLKPGAMLHDCFCFLLYLWLLTRVIVRSAAGNSGSPGNPPNGSLYASADAARVGEGLYHQLVQAACLLAQDPFPRVSQLGKAALLVAGVELTPAQHSPPGHVPRGPSLDRSGLARKYCLHAVLLKIPGRQSHQALGILCMGCFALCCRSVASRAL